MVYIGTLMVNPLVMRRAIGRPKKLRIMTNDELKNPHVLPRNLTSTTCTKCGSMGHNKRTCKGKRATYMVMPKGGNKTKKQKTTKGNGKKKKSNNASQPTQEVGSCSQGPPSTKD
ncbi:unnamed protein product [Lathyrus sativus]|nr:unnamed protein product [Lathyrus sativus]